MRKLLRLEFLFGRRPILVSLAVFSAYFAYMAFRIDSPRVYVVLTSLMLGLAMPFTILGREDKHKTASFVCSLPVRRAMVVLARYATTWLAIGLGMGLALLFTAVLPFARVSLAEVLTVKILVVSLFLISLLFAVILPFTVRFGLTGILILLVGSQLLGILAFILAQLLGGARNPVRIVIGTVERGLRALLGHDGTPGFLLGLVAAALAVNAASLFIARALYARRDL